jgi:hypothetical protein
MAFDYSRLAEGVKLAPTASGAVACVTNPSTTTTYIRMIVVHNVNSTTETVSLYNVPDSGGSVGTASDTTNRFYKEDLPAGATRILEFQAPGIVLIDTNDTIQGVCSVYEKVLVWAYGGAE